MNCTLHSRGRGWTVGLTILNERCKGDFVHLGQKTAKLSPGGAMEQGTGRQARPWPPALTCDVQLVQPVVGQGCVPGAGLRFLLKARSSGWGGPPVLEDLLEQPAHQAQLLQAVADHVPGEATGQVQAGGGQGPAQHRQAGLQIGRSRGKVPLAGSEKV